MPELQLLDSDILKIEKVHKELAKAQRTHRNMEGFRREIIGRFEDVGLVVNVNVYETDQPGCYIPEVEFVDRCEPKAFDHERQGWEVTKDVLDLGEGGHLKSTHEGRAQLKEVVDAHKRGHNHGGHKLHLPGGVTKEIGH